MVRISLHLLFSLQAGAVISGEFVLFSVDFSSRAGPAVIKAKRSLNFFFSWKRNFFAPWLACLTPASSSQGQSPPSGRGALQPAGGPETDLGRREGPKHQGPCSRFSPGAGPPGLLLHPLNPQVLLASPASQAARGGAVCNVSVSPRTVARPPREAHLHGAASGCDSNQRQPSSRLDPRGSGGCMSGLFRSPDSHSYGLSSI